MTDFDEMLKLAETAAGSIDRMLANARRDLERVPALLAVQSRWSRSPGEPKR
jgi:hypothetical protein